MPIKSNLIFNKDSNISIISNMKIGIIGFGNQGRAQALNLHDRNFNVKIGIRDSSKKIKELINRKIKYDNIVEVVKWADLISVLIPDKIIPEVYNKEILPYLTNGKTLLFSHGFNVYYKYITCPHYVNVIMVAPSGGGAIVRKEFKKESGVPSLIAVDNDYTKNAYDIAKSYSRAIGCTRVCSFLSTFREETETDLFGEQVLLTGGIPYMINKSIKVLLEAGYSIEVAWFVCFYEIKTIVDLFHDKGFEYLYQAISDTAKYGGIKSGEFLIDDNIEEKMKKILDDIKTGKFANELKKNNKLNYKNEFTSTQVLQINKLFKNVFNTKKVK